MVLGLVLRLCLSNSNTMYLLVLHFRSLNIIIGIYINIILLPFWISSFVVKMSRKIRTNFPSLLIIFINSNTILCQHAVRYVLFRLSLSRPFSCLKYSSQHSFPIKYWAYSTAMKIHKMYILTEFNLPVLHLSLCMNKLLSKFSTESVYVNCAIFGTHNSLSRLFTHLFFTVSK
jgi:hypothetical protein